METLNTAEARAATTNLGQANTALTTSEENPNFVSSVAGRTAKVKGKGFFKGKGPIGLIIALVFGVGGVMFGSQSLMPFSLLEQFRETFNSMNTSTNLRSKTLVRYQIDTTKIKDPVRFSIFSGNKFKISNSQAQKLSQHGIEYDQDAKVLRFDNGDGNIKVITADDFDNFYRSDPDFFKSYNAGSMTWRGAIANWFGTMTNKFISNNKLTRNRFADFQQKAAAEGGDTRATAIDLMAKDADEIESPGAKLKEADQTEGSWLDKIKNWFCGGECNAKSNGKHSSEDTLYRVEESDNQSNTSRTPRSSIQSESDVRAKLEELGKKYEGGSSITGSAQKVANYACLGLNFIGGVSLLVTASETLQIIHLITSYSESIDKVKAGDGNDSPIHDLANGLTEKKTNTHVDFDGNETSTKKSAMEANGITALYSGSAVDYNDPSVASFNFTKNIKRVLGGVGLSMGAFSTCAFAKMATNAAGVVQSGLEIAGCIAGIFGAAFTFGASAATCSGLVGDIFTGIGISIAASLTIAGIISFITPVVTKMLTRDLIADLGGEDLGNALTSGANIYLGNTHRANGGSLASYDKYVEYAAAQQQVIAENAAYERASKSPFDASSQYTFLGSMLTKFMSFAGISSLSSAITTTSSAVSASLISLLPSATAYDIASNLIPENEYEEICPYLASIGATGDAYCNPYSITDVSTISTDPSEVVDWLADNTDAFLDETTEDGNVKIDGSSDLAKYINFCDNRTSAFGIADQNIVNEVSNWGTVHTENSTFNTITNAAIGAVPVIGDFIDVVTNGQALANAGYVSGESCVAGNTVNGIATDQDGVTVTGSPSWSTAKYYQRFIEDQSVMESMGIIEKSAVTAYLDDYYTKNPLDNSYEGILARYSGLEKEDVIALLDIMEYENYIASYDPTERFQFAPVVAPADDIYFESTSASNTLAVLPRMIIFTDLRNKFFAIS